MIAEPKISHAIAAIRDVLVLGRKMAHEKVDHDKIAKLLDYAEYLPSLVLDSKDCTAEFRGNLEEIAQKFDSSWILDRFDRDANSHI